VFTSPAFFPDLHGLASLFSSVEFFWLLSWTSFAGLSLIQELPSLTLKLHGAVFFRIFSGLSFFKGDSPAPGACTAFLVRRSALSELKGLLFFADCMSFPAAEFSQLCRDGFFFRGRSLFTVCSVFPVLLYS